MRSPDIGARVCAQGHVPAFRGTRLAVWPAARAGAPERESVRRRAAVGGGEAGGQWALQL